MERKNTSVIEDLMEISSALPWKIGVALAVVAYLILHYYATRAPLSFNPAELKSTGKTVADSAFHVMWSTMAMYLQYIIPIAFLAGALVSFLRRRRQSELFVRVADDSSSNALEKMTWREFEDLVAETFRRRGYRVVERGGNSPDGGVDLELYMGSDKYLVQCKRWKSVKVGVTTVRELYGVMAAERAVGGYVVASGDFTTDAKTFAEGRSIQLVDASELRSMIGVSTGPVSRPQTMTAPPEPRPIEPTPACPKCGSPMVRRIAKKGSHAGSSFWGCSHFPGCNGIRS